MSALAYSTHGIALFRGVTNAEGLVPRSIGAGLIATGTVLSLIREQLRTNQGEPGKHQAVLIEAFIDFSLLGLYTWLAGFVWTATQNIATDIYPDTKLEALIHLLGTVLDRFKDYSFSILGVGAALKDSAVVATSLVAYALTLIAHWQLEVLQVSIYNVVLSFGPILIGLQSLGFNTRRLWLAAVIEVSSWSITFAVVYRSIDATMTDYLTAAQGLNFVDTSFLDVLAGLGFLSSLPFIVPLVTGRLIGTQALGALGQVSFGATFLDAAITGMRRRMASIGGAAEPYAGDASAHTAPKPQRPDVARRPEDE